MPRKAKQPAVPIEMPRTENDLDRLMRAVEEHSAVGHELGEKLNAGKLSIQEVLARAGRADERLYNICDQIAMERVEEREAEIREENSVASES